MRVGEACRLDRDDVDLAAALITIRNSKFGMSRAIPVHPSTVAAAGGVWPRTACMGRRRRAPILLDADAYLGRKYSEIIFWTLALGSWDGQEDHDARGLL
jgi:integrase